MFAQQGGDLKLHLPSYLTACAQVLYSLADQALHGAAVPTGGCSSQMLADLQDQYGAVPYVRGTHMQARNNHLVGYGGTYYGYTYTRCLAAEVWQQHLSTDPFSPQAGMMRSSRPHLLAEQLRKLKGTIHVLHDDAVSLLMQGVYCATSFWSWEVPSRLMLWCKI